MIRSALYASAVAITLGTVPNNANAVSNATGYLAGQEIKAACSGRAGSISPSGLIERDLNGDGRSDLILSHEAISCSGEFQRSIQCGTQVCTVKIYVRRGQLLEFTNEFLGAGVSVSNGEVPVIQAFGHGGQMGYVRWNGQTFASVEPAQRSFSQTPVPDDDRDTVIQAQKALGYLGYAVGAADGVIGPRTRAAIREYQGDIGTPVTGALTADDLAKLLQSADDLAQYGNDARPPSTSYEASDPWRPQDWGAPCLGDAEWCASQQASWQPEIAHRRAHPEHVEGLIEYLEAILDGPEIKPENVKVLLADLNDRPDDVEELLVFIEGLGYCGTGGCRVLMLQKTSSGFSQLLSETLAYGISLSGGYVNGMHAIVLGGRIQGDSGWEDFSPVWLFDGNQYVLSTDYYIARNNTGPSDGSHLDSNRLSAVPPVASDETQKRENNRSDSSSDRQRFQPEQFVAGKTVSLPPGINGHFAPFRDRELFARADGTGIVEENLSGHGSDDMADWTAWMRLNLPLALPEILQNRLDDSILFSTVILDKAERNAIQDMVDTNEPIYLSDETITQARKTDRLAYTSYQLYRDLERRARGVADTLDEFDKPVFTQRLNQIISNKIDGWQPATPQPFVQKYTLNLGDYDFDLEQFSIESINGQSGEPITSPEVSNFANLATRSYQGIRRARIEANLKEFPLYVPVDVALARAAVNEIKALRGDPYRVAYLWVHGAIVGIDADEKHSGAGHVVAVFKNSIERLEISTDPDGRSVFWSKEISDNRGEALAEATDKGSQAPADVYSMAHLVLWASRMESSFSSLFMPHLFLEQKVIEKTDLRPFGLEGRVPLGVIRSEVVAEKRPLTQHDWEDFSAYMESRFKRLAEKNQIRVPYQVHLTELEDGTIGPRIAQTFDLVTNAILESGGQFDRFGRSRERIKLRDFTSADGVFIDPNHDRERFLGYWGNDRERAAFSGYRLIPAGTIRDPQSEARVGVLFALRKGKFEADRPVQVPWDFSGASDAGQRPHLTGHVALRLIKVREPQTFDFDGGQRSWVIVEVEPTSLFINDDGRTHTIKYDTPKTSPSAKVSQTGEDSSAPEAQAKEKVPLDSLTTELLIVRDAPASLGDMDYKRLLLTRWMYEDAFREGRGTPRGGRFFDAGTLRPSHADLDARLPDFKQWIKEVAAELPNQFILETARSTVVEGKLILSGDRTYGSRNMVSIGLHSCERGVELTKQTEDSWDIKSEAQEKACQYLNQAADYNARDLVYGEPSFLELKKRDYNKASLPFDNYSRHGTIGVRAACYHVVGPRDPYCTAFNEALKDPMFAETNFVLDDLLTVDRLPQVTARDVQTIRNRFRRSSYDAYLVVEVENVAIARSIPLTPFDQASIDTAKFLAEHGIENPMQRTGLEPEKFVPAVTFDLKVVDASIQGTMDNPEMIKLATFEELSPPDATLLSPIAPRKIEVSDAPYGYDIVGIKLGMTFDQADTIIREHMNVGRVLEMDREGEGFIPDLKTTPFTSAIVYLSEDEQELIALFDEPPGVEKFVLGATRQLLFPKGKFSLDQLKPTLTEKYGEEASATRNGIFWGEKRSTCQGGDYSRRGPWWNIDGSSAEVGPYVYGKRDYVPIPLSDQWMDQSVNGAPCMHGVSVNFDSNPTAEWDKLNQFLYDRNAYRKAMQKSSEIRETQSAEALKSEEIKF